jgi:hypothetical protein
MYSTTVAAFIIDCVMGIETNVMSLVILTVVLLKIQVFLYVMPCCWIYSSTCFEDEVSVTICTVRKHTPMTQHHIPELLNILSKTYKKRMHLVPKS